MKPREGEHMFWVFEKYPEPIRVLVEKGNTLSFIIDDANFKNISGYIYDDSQNLFATRESAMIEIEERYVLYNKTFSKSPKVSLDSLKAHRELLMNVEDAVINKLKDSPNFNGIRFVENHRGLIALRLYHKRLHRIAFYEPFILRHYNISMLSHEIGSLWESLDNPRYIAACKKILKRNKRPDWAKIAKDMNII